MIFLHEVQLHEVLKNNPYLIDEELTFISQEVPMGYGLRCDLLFKDKEDKNVYIEVKWIAGRRAVVQVEQYEILKKDQNSRYILVAINAEPGIEEILNRRGFEYKEIGVEELLIIKPEWKEDIFKIKNKKKYSKENIQNNSLTIPSGLKESRISILKALEGVLLEDFPEIRFSKSKESRYRLSLNWDSSEKDFFIFDFSNKDVLDGIRCCFVVDLDEPNSSRRDNFKQYLIENMADVEETLGMVIENGISDEVLQSQGLLSWTKISNHRRKGIHTYFRFIDTNWCDEGNIVNMIVPKIYFFIERLDSLLRVYKPS